MRAPLLWIIVPLITGYLIVEVLRCSLPLLALVFAALLLALSGLKTIKADRLRYLFPFCLTIGITSIAMAYASIRHPMNNGEGSAIAAREGWMRVEVKQTFRNNTASDKWRGLVRVIQSDLNHPNLTGKTLYLACNKVYKSPSSNTELSVRCVLSPINTPTNDFEAWLNNNGIFWQATHGIILRTNTPEVGWKRFIQSLDQRIHEILVRNSSTEPSDESRLLECILLGKKHLLTTEQYERYLRTGCLHLMAVSGLHIGVLALFVQQLGALLRLPKHLNLVMTSILCGTYVLLVGCSESAIRAFWMLLCLCGGHFLMRRSTPISALMFAALVQLLWNPRNLFNVGFQLSYLVVLAIFVIALPLQQQLRDQLNRYNDSVVYHPFRRFMLKCLKCLIPLLSINIAAFIATLPIQIGISGLIIPGSLALNLALIPLSSLLMINTHLCVMTSLCGLNWLGQFLLHGAEILAYVLDTLTRIGAKMPLFWIERQFTNLSHQPILAVLSFGMLLIFTIHYRNSWTRWSLCLCLLLSCIITTH
jgi:competence protein ComEC